MDSPTFTPCGHTATKHLNNTNSTSPEAITEARLEIQTKVNFLRMKQVPFLRYLNTLQSPACSIPTEILSRIFELYAYATSTDQLNCESRHETKNRNHYRYLHSVLKLGAVSIRWRNVAHSIPQLWTSLRVELCLCLDVQEKMAFLQYYLQRAGNHPLSLAFELNDSSSYIRREDYDKKTVGIKATLDFSLQEYSTRIKALELSRLEKSSWLSDLFKDRSFPQLQSLVISEATCLIPPVEQEFWQFLIPAIPTLRNLCITSLDTHALIILSSHKITRLHLYMVPQAECLRLLEECRETLIEFMSGSHRKQCPPPTSTHLLLLYPTIILPHLKTFHWTFQRHIDRNPGLLSPWDQYILRGLDMPSLQNLSLDTLDPGLEVTTSPNSFTRIHGTLDNLEINSKDAIKNGLSELLGMVDTRRLILKGYEEGELNLVFDALEKTSCIPSLKVLRLSTVVNMFRRNHEYCSAFILMLEKRVEFYALQANDKFVLELPLDRIVVQEILENNYKEWMTRLLDLPIRVVEVLVDEWDEYEPVTRSRCCHEVYSECIDDAY